MQTLMKKKHFYSNKCSGYLCICKKSSTFAVAFGKRVRETGLLTYKYKI